MSTNKLDLSTVLKTAEKKYSINAGRMSEIASDVKGISTGNMGIDAVTGVGGLPLGRSVEMYGPPSSGKSTACIQTAGSLQKIILEGGDPERGIGPDDKIAYADFEQAIDPQYARSLGFDIDDDSCIFFQPDELENGTDFIIDLIKTGTVRMVIIDSIAQMLPRAIAEESVGKSLPAVAAKLINIFFQKVTPLLAEFNCLLASINHSKEKMGMGGYGGPVTTTPGGMSPKYNASVRLEFKPIKQYKSKIVDPLTREEVEIPTATDVRVKATKNKVGPPFRQAVVKVRFGKGFDEFATALTVLIASKKVMWEAGGGGRYYFHNIEEDGFAPDWMPRASTGTKRPYVQGKEKIHDVATEYPEWKSGLIALARGIVAENIARGDSPVPQAEPQEELGVSSSNSSGSRRAKI